MCNRNPIQCIIPPYVHEQLTKSSNPKTRARAIASLATAAAIRATRNVVAAMPTLFAAVAPTATKHRLVYTANNTPDLPGDLARSEGQAKVADVGVNEAYDYAGDTYDFYDKLFARNSLDDAGMTLKSSVHVADVDDTGNFVPMNNAFWNGEQMAYGDGDGAVFQRFTKSLDVVGHELTHGVESFTSNLTYFDQSGALNEHFADVFGILVRQWKNGEKAASANWIVGAEVLVPAPTRTGIRNMEHPGTAFQGDPDLGDDPQPDHMSKYYKGPRDRNGVHINSGIPNRAFVLTAQALKGNAWDVAGRIWYETLLALTPSSRFIDCAKMTVLIATSKGAAAKKAVKAAWKKVGITV
ncbi:MAG: M4 family metallopeptidase [Planctomycetes bacterium]|nr:M4 family metallopeptidase [Planctomycetota bacterium]